MTPYHQRLAEGHYQAPAADSATPKQTDKPKPPTTQSKTTDK